MSVSNFLFKSLTALALVVSVNAMADDMSLSSLDPKEPCPRPDYPRASLANEEQGATTISLLVGVDGKVTDSRIDKSSGFKNLDKATLKLAQCKFKPVLKDGKPDPTWISLEYDWKLD
jgi:periplasmic protein TonB